MNRRNFIKGVAVGSIAVAVAPALLVEEIAPTQFDVMAAIKAQIESSKFKPTSIVMGWENDDFLNNVLTVHSYNDEGYLKTGHIKLDELSIQDIPTV